jgi:Domain of unknown function (DUF4276)
MRELRYTLRSDGSSDRALIPILDWLLRNHLGDFAIQNQWADLRSISRPRNSTLSEEIKLSIELYPCDLLFVHRDAEKEAYEVRIEEIRSAISQLDAAVSVPTVCVIPVRMTEAWLLFDTAALRKAASNPNGRINLQLPILKQIDSEPDPKKVLHNLLRQASELPPGRIKKFPVHERVHRLAELIDDFSYLRILPAFAALESEIKEVIDRNGWK